MKVGIIGAGVMGTGIAQVFAQTKRYELVLCSRSAESANAGLDTLARRLRGRASQGKLPTEEAEAMLATVRVGTLADCADCALVIEAVTEDLREKKSVFRALDAICAPDCLFVSNTSSLPLSKMAEGLGRPVSGMHFFNPAPVMKLVEVVSDDPALSDRIAAVAESVGKTPVRVKESPAFVTNRLLIPLINDAVRLYADGIASAADIDTAMRLGANHPMGPLALGDLVGWDVCLAILQELHASLGEEKYRPHPLIERLVAEGKLGKKTGAGIYEY